MKHSILDTPQRGDEAYQQHGDFRDTAHYVGDRFWTATFRVAGSVGRGALALVDRSPAPEEAASEDADRQSTEVE